MLVAESDPGRGVAAHSGEVIANCLWEGPTSLLIDGASTGMPDEFEHADEVLRSLGRMLQVFDTLLQQRQVDSWMSCDFALYPHNNSFKASGCSLETGRTAHPYVIHITR
jgi:hypothetical protein